MLRLHQTLSYCLKKTEEQAKSNALNRIFCRISNECESLIPFFERRAHASSSEIYLQQVFETIQQRSEMET